MKMWWSYVASVDKTISLYVPCGYLNSTCNLVSGIILIMRVVEVFVFQILIVNEIVDSTSISCSGSYFFVSYVR